MGRGRRGWELQWQANTGGATACACCAVPLPAAFRTMVTGSLAEGGDRGACRLKRAPFHTVNRPPFQAWVPGVLKCTNLQCCCCFIKTMCSFVKVFHRLCNLQTSLCEG